MQASVKRTPPATFIDFAAATVEVKSQLFGAVASEPRPSFMRGFRAWVVLPERRAFGGSAGRDILSALRACPLSGFSLVLLLPKWLEALTTSAAWSSQPAVTGWGGNHTLW